MSTTERCALVDRQGGGVSIARQCHMLGLSRSTLYYKPTGVRLGELAMIRVLDALYLEDPSRGTRRMARELNKRGYKIRS